MLFLIVASVFSGAAAIIYALSLPVLLRDFMVFSFPSQLYLQGSLFIQGRIAHTRTYKAKPPS